MITNRDPIDASIFSLGFLAFFDESFQFFLTNYFFLSEGRKVKKLSEDTIKRKIS